MIVLAVTGALFVAIAATLTGRQRSNEFTQSINDVRTRIQQIMTEARNGYYPSATTFNCSAVGNSLSIVVGTPTQGSRTDCVFLGKVLQFNSSGLNPEDVEVYPVAGIRTATDITVADPSVVSNSQVDTSETFSLKYGLTVEKMRAGGSNVGAFGILSSMDSINPGKSGDQQFDIYAYRDVPFGHSKLTDGNNLTANYVKNPSGGVQICFKSGGTNQYGLVTIGNNSSQLSVDLKVMDTICW
jgi:type II secretory pathway pseudopilin PulG